MELSDEDVAKLLAKDIDQHKSKARFRQPFLCWKICVPPQKRDQTPNGHFLCLPKKRQDETFFGKKEFLFFFCFFH